jgi:hypothetical protein
MVKPYVLSMSLGCGACKYISWSWVATWMVWSFRMGISRMGKEACPWQGWGGKLFERCSCDSRSNCDCQSGELLILSIFCEMFFNSSALSFSQLRNHLMFNLQGYSWEVTTAEGGQGLNELLSSRKSVLNGTYIWVNSFSS